MDHTIANDPAPAGGGRPGRVAALVLAAGFSTRMDGFKPLLPLGGVSVLRRCAGLFFHAGVERIMVVAGHRADDVLAEATRFGIEGVRNPYPDRGMFSSVQAGVAALPEDTEAFFLLPVDIPLVRVSTVKTLLSRWRSDGPGVLLPSFNGKRGHPPLISMGHAQRILNWQKGGGLRALLNGLPGVDVPVPDSNILTDMDTGEDYRAAQIRLRRSGIATPEETRALLDILDMNERGRAHGEAVAKVALCFAKALNAAGRALDLESVRTAGLLHDVAKGKPDHEREGGVLLRGYGFSDTAAIVAAHRDVSLPEGELLGEREVVYLADKFVRGASLIPLEARFQEKLDLHAGDEAATAAITRRLNNARRVLAALEAEAGRSVDKILAGCGVWA
ncbi:DVU_1551 family NTP transferase [Fundidesulfovibrio soli]|uniref:DVU_1551 family NTP transferase n=1 Tax=Fundidesulfovibrio soli TaxID=2922716 RepID=UPI001FB02C8E|nr:NTP transferase domain-containing protein [Fundidesulfovibrio soli]